MTGASDRFVVNHQQRPGRTPLHDRHRQPVQVRQRRTHPCTVNLREGVVTARINEWIGSLFAPQNRDATIRAFGIPGRLDLEPGR